VGKWRLNVYDCGMKEIKDNWLTIDSWNYSGLFYYAGDTLCRRELHIKHKDSQKTKADMLVIMMNPGGSKPIFKLTDIEICKKKGYTIPQILPYSLVPTCSDNTQQRVIKFMSCRNKEYAIVLNLTDYCNTDNGNIRKVHRELSSFFQNSSNTDNFDEIWAKTEDLEVLLAYGRTKVLKTLAVNVKVILKNKGIKRVWGKTDKFYHPLYWPNINEEIIEHNL
jgi:hypothetical protein